MLRKALEIDVCSHRGPHFWGTWMDAPLLGSFERRDKFVYLGEFL